MKYLLYILMVAVIFGLIALIDWGFGKLFPKSELEQRGKVVRLPRYSFILGLLMAVIGLMVALLLSPGTQLYLWLGSLVVTVMGVFLLVNFFSFAIYYDDTGFSYRTLTRRKQIFRYADITGQRSFLARSGVNILLYVNGQEVALYTAMQGLKPFLETAFRAWCKSRDVDPDTVQTNPDYFSYFPEQDA